MRLEKEVLVQLGKVDQEIFNEIFKDDPIADPNNDLVADADNGSRQC